MNYELIDLPEHLRCPCCNTSVKAYDFVVKCLEDIRAVQPLNFVLSSYYRCNKHNREVGGSTTSRHIKTLAFDLSVTNYINKYTIIEWVILTKNSNDKLFEYWKYCDEIELTPKHIHLGFSLETKPTKLIIK